MNETLTFEDVIRLGVKEALLNVNVSMPGIVEKFDSEKNTITVRPSLMKKYEAEDGPVEMPLINNVPVVYPRSKNFSIKFRLEKGDVVQLVFSQRSLDIWKSKGGVVDPEDPRKFHIADAIAYPGGYPSVDPIPGDVSDRTIIKSGSSKIEMLDNGKFKIQGAHEYLDLMSQVLGKMISLTEKLGQDKVNTSIGPQPLNKFADYTTLSTDLTGLKTKLDAIKG